MAKKPSWAYYYIADDCNVVDGDTYDFVIDLGRKSYVEHRERLAGANTPETYRPKSEEERKKGEAAKRFASKVLRKIKRKYGYFVIRTFKDKTGARGRFISDVCVPANTLTKREKEKVDDYMEEKYIEEFFDGYSEVGLAELLIIMGHAKKYYWHKDMDSPWRLTYE